MPRRAQREFDHPADRPADKITPSKADRGPSVPRSGETLAVAGGQTEPAEPGKHEVLYDYDAGRGLWRFWVRRNPRVDRFIPVIGGEGFIGNTEPDERTTIRCTNFILRHYIRQHHPEATSEDLAVRKMAPAEVAAVEKIGKSVVLDLRSPEERAERMGAPVEAPKGIPGGGE